MINLIAKKKLFCMNRQDKVFELPVV